MKEIPKLSALTVKTLSSKKKSFYDGKRQKHEELLNSKTTDSNIGKSLAIAWLSDPQRTYEDIQFVLEYFDDYSKISKKLFDRSMEESIQFLRIEYKVAVNNHVTDLMLLWSEFVVTIIEIDKTLLPD